MKLLGAGVLFAAVACAQTYEIRGSVTEPGVGGIPDVPLSVRQLVPAVEGGVRTIRDEPLPIQAATDGRGNFRISVDRPGAYSVRPVFNNRAYYPVFIEGATEGMIRLDAANPRAEVNFSFVRTGQITGLVLDEETRQPVPEFPVTLYLRGAYERGFPVDVFPREPVVTNRDGRFTMTQVRPGDYVVGTRPSAGRRYQSADEPDPNPDALDSGYAETFWPGGASDIKTAPPIRLGSGGIADIGTVLLHKVPLYKMRLSIPQGDCPEGESVRVMLLQSGAPDPVRPPNVLPCGGAGVLRGFDSGTYTLYAVSDWQGEREGIDKAVWATAPVTIADKNEDVTLVLEHGALLEGHVSVPEGKTMPEKHPAIAAQPVEVIPGTRPPMEQFVEWTSDSTFRMMVHASPQSLYSSGLPAGWYVKEIRYNGAVVRNDIIPVSSGAAAQTLEIVMDDKAAQVSATVSFGTRPDVRAVVLLEKWPLGSISAGVWGVSAAEIGQFRFQNVTPGEYRILAVAAGDRPRLSEPGVRERLLATAEKITIAPGVSQNITVRLTEIGR